LGVFLWGRAVQTWRFVCRRRRLGGLNRRSNTRSKAWPRGPNNGAACWGVCSAGIDRRVCRGCSGKCVQAVSAFTRGTPRVLVPLSRLVCGLDVRGCVAWGLCKRGDGVSSVNARGVSGGRSQAGGGAA